MEDVIFTGKVDVTEYLGKMDMTILTSISEGQPLKILDSFAAKKPVIATDVGNCRDHYTYHECGGDCGSDGRSGMPQRKEDWHGKKRIPETKEPVSCGGYERNIPADLPAIWG